MSGYARAHRGRWDHPIFKNRQEAAIWAWMTDTARWKPHSFQTRFGIVHLARGQLLVSERTIAEDFGLGRQQVRRLMDNMEISAMIARNSTHGASRAGTIITIINYERYQGDAEDEAHPPPPGRPKRQPKTNPKLTQDQPTREEREKGEEREEGVSPSDSSPNGAPTCVALVCVDEVGAAFEAYQACRSECVSGARPLELSADRRKHLVARLREAGGAAGWADVLSRIRGSSFLRGETSRGGKFVPEIDWLLKPSNFRKVLEGNYDDRDPNNGRQQRPAPTSPVDAMRIARARLGFGGPGVHQ